MKAYVAIGANMGNPRRTLGVALLRLNELADVTLTRVSPLYKTQAVGGPRQRDYLNGVAEVETRVAPAQLLERLLRIEKGLGRKRRIKWGPRVIDLDLLAYGKRRIDLPEFTLPHPRYHERRFVLIPFCDLAPAFVHPRLKTRNSTLLRKLTPQGQRVTIDAQWNGSQFIPSKTKRSAKPRS